jgi:hypothetical protein
VKAVGLGAERAFLAVAQNRSATPCRSKVQSPLMAALNLCTQVKYVEVIGSSNISRTCGPAEIGCGLMQRLLGWRRSAQQPPKFAIA